jgi:hypothetical protein
MSVHRGLLGVIRIRQSLTNAHSAFETQILGKEEEKCEYFETVWLEDRKHWFVLSYHEDGSLRVTLPEPISKAVLEKELAILINKNKLSQNQ